MEASFHIAVWATAFYVILGITSLPSVGAVLNWREWRFVQSYMGHFCLILACAHACVLKYSYFHSTLKSFVEIIQQPEMLCQLLAFLALGLRFILWMPCVSSYVWKIRKGYVRGAKSDVEQGKQANGRTNESFQMNETI
ncbi:hypothetical protein CAPTEDRAFT_108747 [Capitella teleta]|uniref:Ferric oxidoreductase domain-containing protein n=1 Tax=Capitella teleta TaxID=283909 RepID=R7TH89_CAPTE|nr:hypothetical protein CAPTEDRAFT_108747 [Capitella teleta]|eukprot:ELT90946.1 hypothetical protein CAPTEDRAFT_108747 [Capitella teleta]